VGMGGYAHRDGVRTCYRVWVGDTRPGVTELPGLTSDPILRRTAGVESSCPSGPQCRVRRVHKPVGSPHRRPAIRRPCEGRPVTLSAFFPSALVHLRASDRSPVRRSRKGGAGGAMPRAVHDRTEASFVPKGVGFSPPGRPGRRGRETTLEGRRVRATSALDSEHPGTDKGVGTLVPRRRGRRIEPAGRRPASFATYRTGGGILRSSVETCHVMRFRGEATHT